MSQSRFSKVKEVKSGSEVYEDDSQNSTAQTSHRQSYKLILVVRQDLKMGKGEGIFQFFNLEFMIRMISRVAGNMNFVLVVRNDLKMGKGKSKLTHLVTNVAL